MELERRHLLHLAAVARHRNVTRAAESLGITQPTLSRSIQEVERLLGLRCFDRLPQGVEPTPACRTVLERAKAVIDGFAEIERQAQRIGEIYSGRLVVGFGPAVSAGSSMLEVGRLVALHPRLQARVVIASPAELLQRLVSRELDLFAADQSVLGAGKDGFVVESLDYQGVLMCRPGHPILEAESPLEAVTRHPIAILAPPAAGLASLRALLREADPTLRPDWTPALEVDHAPALERMLLDWDFLGASAVYAHAQAVASGALRVVPLRPIYVGSVGPVRLRDRTPSAAGEGLWKAIAEALRRDLAPQPPRR